MSTVMRDPHGLPFHSAATHVDAAGMPVAFYRGPGAPEDGWAVLVTPCCGAAASIDDGPMYCKKCYHDVPWSYGGVPREPVRMLGELTLDLAAAGDGSGSVRS